MTEHSTDSRYLDIFLNPVRLSAGYAPRFGTAGSRSRVSLLDFRELYGNDLFYSWIGLDSDLMYAAHKAAGGMTSIYRQVGMGCERLFRQILADTAEYRDLELASWSYTTQTPSGKTKVQTLDGRLGINDISSTALKERIVHWIAEYCDYLKVPQVPNNGAVFEIRQGYKSKDSKRQNADIDNATVAWSHGYLPVVAVFSQQIDADIALRYRNNGCGILIGTIGGGNCESVYDFMNDVVGYDLSGFFMRTQDVIRSQIQQILEILLRPS